MREALRVNMVYDVIIQILHGVIKNGALGRFSGALTWSDEAVHLPLSAFKRSFI